MLALQREAAWAEERLWGHLRQPVPQNRPRPFTPYGISENNKRNNGNNRSSGINDGAQRTLATTLIVGT